MRTHTLQSRRKKHKGRYFTFSIILIFLITFFTAALFALQSNTLTQQKAKADTSLVAWKTFDFDNQRSGNNILETTITPQNVAKMQQIWQVKLPNTVDSAPVELPNVLTSQGLKNLLFVNTLKGSLLAIDADSGTTVWRKDNQKLNITTSTPVIDSAGQYIYSYALDGKVHKYAVTDGTEQIDGIWPVTITLIPGNEKGSSAINIINGYLYMTTSTYPNQEGLSSNHYNGHVVGVNLATGAVSIFNTLCSNMHELLTNASGSANFCPQTDGGVWSRAGATLEPLNNNIYITVGNGLYDANTGGVNYGDSIIELSPDLSQIIDTYTPTNFANLDAKDLDIGITAPVLLPVQTGTNTPYLLAQGGKEKVLRLINRQNLSGQGGPNHIGGELQTVTLIGGCIMFPQPLAWNDTANTTWVFAMEGCGLYAFKVINNGQSSSLQLQYQNATLGGSSGVIANNILFVQGKTAINAIDPTTGTVLWSTPSAGLHWQSPIVVNSHLYTADNSGHLTAYGLPAVTATPSPTPTPTLAITLTPTDTPTPTPTPAVYIYDKFQRPNQKYWGTATDGNVWSGDANKLSVFSISNNTGVINGNGYFNALLGPQVADAETVLQGSITAFSPGNIGPVLRYTDSKNWYRAQIDGHTLYLQKNINNIISTITSTPFSATANASYTIRFRVQGTALSAKAWQSTQPEPANWMLTTSDASLTIGYGGMRTRVATASAAFTLFSLTGL